MLNVKKLERAVRSEVMERKDDGKFEKLGTFANSIGKG